MKPFLHVLELPICGLWAAFLLEMHIYQRHTATPCSPIEYGVEDTTKCPFPQTSNDY